MERVRRSSARIEAAVQQQQPENSYIILTHEHDIHLLADLLTNKESGVAPQNGTGVKVCSAELIYSAILRQSLEIDRYNLTDICLLTFLSFFLCRYSIKVLWRCNWTNETKNEDSWDEDIFFYLYFVIWDMYIPNISNCMLYFFWVYNWKNYTI